MEPRPKSFYFFAAFFALFVLFLYGPTLTIAILLRFVNIRKEL